MDLKSYIGMKVAAARRRRGLTQEELATRIDRAVETISNIERGFALTGLDTLERVADVLDAPIASFLEGYEQGLPVAAGRRRREEVLLEAARVQTDDDLELSILLISAVTAHRQS
jgi:transcriptional regulator with XRE-family HTH domain